ncbi:MAG: C4-type zinc ribbon domain-containing protein [Bryobacterales bacterium]|nr:C4-type zinc ribbon domain-containing protein [Bryobacteraceae bacterium]MDW8354149.1 C4-type zinc ribbon domain-containing protein [Bryobacterales bacterium]
MAPDLKLAIRLQEIDTEIQEVEEEIASLPRHIAAIEKTLESHIRRLEADQAALAANQKERRRLEGDVQMLQQKASRLKDQMMEARTNEQYWAFQKEIEYVENEIRKAEDRILDLMAEAETLERNVKSAEAALKLEKQRVEAEKEDARRRTAADRQRLGELHGERQTVVAAMSPKIYAAYEKIRAKRKGLAVAEVADGHCNACHIALRPQFYQDVKSNQSVMFCESCGRILYYKPPTSCEEELASQPSTAG